MRRWQKIFTGTVVGGVLFSVIIWFWGAGLLSFSEFCWYSYEDLRLGPYLPPVDETEVLLLGGLKDEHAPFLESGVSYYRILGRTTLYGKEAEAIAEDWRCLPRNPRLSDLCHNPLYALRFKSNGHLLLQTTICWHCNNYSISTSENPWMDVEFGFDSSSRISRAFLSALEKYVPPTTR